MTDPLVLAEYVEAHAAHNGTGRECTWCTNMRATAEILRAFAELPVETQSAAAFAARASRPL